MHTGSMDSTADDELAGELRVLTRQLRGQLLHHAALGAWAAPGSDTTRSAPPADVTSATDASPDERAAAQTPGQAPARERGSEPPGHAPDAAPAWDEPGSIGDAVPIAALAADAPVRLGRRTLPEIRAELGDCTRCKLHTTRRSIVFGVGAPDAQLMFVGEAPGENEDRRGEPFVGAAGELLDKMIEAMGWTRNAVYIANTTKCRPPGNRNPQADELEQCIPFLHAQIASVAPRIIVALGRPASNQLLEVDAPISSLRGRFHDYARHPGLRIMPTFHPAYLLRDPDKKRQAWSDLKLVMAELARLGIAPPPAA